MAHNHPALWLSVFTVVYNVIEGVVSIAFASTDGSSALLGFGADSFVESISGAVLIWRFSKPGDARERMAARLVGVSFLVLAAYVTYESFSALTGAEETGRSLAAIIIAALSLLIMPTVFVLKRRTAERLRSRSLFADSKQTLACMMLSIALLVGTGLNYWVGMWYADPVAGLLIASYLVWEGWEAIAKCEVCEC